VTDSIGAADDAQEATRAGEAQSDAQARRLGSDPVDQPGALRTIAAVGLQIGPDPAHALIEGVGVPLTDDGTDRPHFCAQNRPSGLVLLIFGGLAIGLVLVGGVLAYGTRRAADQAVKDCSRRLRGSAC
jgi:hypothetical protein